MVEGDEKHLDAIPPVQNKVGTNNRMANKAMMLHTQEDMALVKLPSIMITQAAIRALVTAVGIGGYRKSED